ncbi:MAG: hypothetical protein ACLP01_19610 [Solirubrobacteraceae bacterium]
MLTVLIELPGGEGIVRRDDGEMVVTGDVNDQSGSPIARMDYRPVTRWLDGDSRLVGGLLPPGALSAELIDDIGTRISASVGGGAYVAIVNESDPGYRPVVCCRDFAGDPVARPLPSDWSRIEVSDAEVPCPACGAVAYDEVIAADGSRGGRFGHGHDGPLEPARITVCRVCGHEEGAGRSISRFGSADDEPEDETAAAERLELRRAHDRLQKWYLDTLTLRCVAFPIYAAENWRAQIGDGWGTLAKPIGTPSKSAGEDVTHLTVDHFSSAKADRFTDPPRLKVTTSVEDAQYGDTQLDQARWVLALWQQESQVSWPRVSDAALKVWLAARDRQGRAAVRAATQTEQLITIDGTPQPFLTLTPPSGRWVAVRHHGDLTITVAANDLAPTTIELEPITDPPARLLGPEPVEH